MFNLIMKASEKYEKKTSIEVCVKTMEELGEVAQALLSSKDICGWGYKGFTREDVLEEVADVIICATSMAQKEGFSVEELESEIKRKINKWISKVLQEEDAPTLPCESEMGCPFHDNDASLCEVYCGGKVYE